MQTLGTHPLPCTLVYYTRVEVIDLTNPLAYYTLEIMPVGKKILVTNVPVLSYWLNYFFPVFIKIVQSLFGIDSLN